MLPKSGVKGTASYVLVVIANQPVAVCTGPIKVNLTPAFTMRHSTPATIAVVKSGIVVPLPQKGVARGKTPAVNVGDLKLTANALGANDHAAQPVALVVMVSIPEHETRMVPRPVSLGARTLSPRNGLRAVKA
jgi:hypothetical protein